MCLKTLIHALRSLVIVLSELIESSYGTIVPRKKEELGGLRRDLEELGGTIVPLG